MAENTGIEAIGVVNHMKKKGSLKVIVLGFVIGVVLLVVGGIALPSASDRVEKADEEGGDYESFLQYKETVRREIEEICMSVSGVRGVSVAVFFDGIGESVYATNTQSGNSERIEYVVIGSGSGAHALYLGESLPKLVGIGVVCSADGGERTESELSALLAATYGLPLTRVRVIVN